MVDRYVGTNLGGCTDPTRTGTGFITGTECGTQWDGPIGGYTGTSRTACGKGDNDSKGASTGTRMSTQTRQPAYVRVHECMRMGGGGNI